MAIRFSTGLRNDLLDTGDFGTIFTNGVIYIYSGSQPAAADNAVSGTLLAKVTLNGGAFAFGSPTNGLNFEATATDGTLPKAAAETWQWVGEAAGTAGWFRLMGNPVDNLGASTTLPRMDGSIGTFGADLNLSNVNIAVSQTGTIDTFSISIAAN
ncbi:MAG: hypothetical protein JSW51_09255 [Gemmatimonadota bacterium]|nr:MAG: hypothetical protein JSW51_09255 [Gemmatimonadota bacterium]